MPNTRFAMSSSGLELTDYVKMTQLQNPMILISKFLRTAKIVAHDGTDAFSDIGRERFYEPQPSFQVFGTFQKEGIQEESVMTCDRFESTQMENPSLLLESEPCPIEQENQWASGASLSRFLQNESSQSFSKLVTQTLRTEIMPSAQTEECLLLLKDSFQQNKTYSARRPTSLFDSDSPSSLAVCALPASLAKTTNLCATTPGYSGHVFHANRVATFRGAGKNLLSYENSYS